MSPERAIGELRELSRKEIAARFKELHIPVSTIWDREGGIDKNAQTVVCKRAARIAKGLFCGGSSGGGGDEYFRPEHTAALVSIAVEVRGEEGRESDLLIEYGVYGHTAEEAAKFAHAGHEAGGDLAVVPSLYFKYNPETSDVQLPTDSQEAKDKATLDFYINYARATGGRYFVLYNIPGACFKDEEGKGYSISPELLDKILAAVPSTIGIKDSSTNGRVTQAYIKVARKHALSRGEDVDVLSGFFPTKGALLGESSNEDANGGVPIEANLLKLIPLVLWQAARARDFGAVERIQDLAQEFLDWVVGGRDKKGFPELVRGTGYALLVDGIGGGYMPPGQPALDDPVLKEQIKTIMERFADERRVLVDAGISIQYINEAEEIIAERKARAVKILGMRNTSASPSTLLSASTSMGSV